MIQELQILRAKNQVLKIEVEQLKTQRVQEPVVPRQEQEKPYQHVPMGLHNMFLFYQEEEEL